MNVLFTCGGTAGHVNPAVALARIFQEKNPGCKVLFVGADGSMENKLVPKEGYQIRSVTITNFHRSMLPADILHNVGTLLNMQRSKKQARAILEEYGVGGWAGFSGHDPNVLDGSSFRLEAVLADGTRIEAHGENKFPPNYRDVMSALDDLTAAAQKNALQQYTP